MMADDANVQCPCNEEFECKGMITELEMKSVCLCLVLVYPLGSTYASFFVDLVTCM